MWNLPGPSIEPISPGMGGWILNPCTTREVPNLLIFIDGETAAQRKEPCQRATASHLLVLRPLLNGMADQPTWAAGSERFSSDNNRHRFRQLINTSSIWSRSRRCLLPPTRQGKSKGTFNSLLWVNDDEVKEGFTSPS